MKNPKDMLVSDDELHDRFVRSDLSHIEKMALSVLAKHKSE